MIAVQPGTDQGIPALMNQDDRPGLLGHCPHRKKLRVVESLAVHMIANHRPLQSQLRHRPLQLRGRRPRILHRQIRQPRKPVRIILDQLRHIIVALPVHRRHRGRVLLVKVKDRIGREDMQIHPDGIHIGQPLLRRPQRPGHRPVKLIRLRGNPIPIPPRFQGANIRLRANVRVNVNGTH